MIEEKDICTTIKDRTDALGFFKLMGIKEITTSRQKKNGTTVYELPISRLSYTGRTTKYKYAIYDSGYIRDVSEYNHSPWYINKRYTTKTKYYFKEYVTCTSEKPIFIKNFDSQLVYLANYILKNRYSKLYSCCDWNIEQIKECSQFRYDARWKDDTITITRDEYVELQVKANPNIETRDDVQVIINGHRYNLS
jgi:hypothetical protein